MPSLIDGLEFAAHSPSDHGGLSDTCEQPVRRGGKGIQHCDAGAQWRENQYR